MVIMAPFFINVRFRSFDFDEGDTGSGGERGVTKKKRGKHTFFDEGAETEWELMSFIIS